MAFVKTIRPGHDHAADHVRALDVRVVVDFDPLWRLFEIEGFCNFFQEPRLAGAFGELPAQRLGCVAAGLFHQTPFIAALRRAYFNLAVGFQCQCVTDQASIARRVIGQDKLRRRSFIIELNQKGGQNFGFAFAFFMARKMNARAPILAGADEEDLHR